MGFIVRPRSFLQKYADYQNVELREMLNSAAGELGITPKEMESLGRSDLEDKMVFVKVVGLLEKKVKDGTTPLFSSGIMDSLTNLKKKL